MKLLFCSRVSLFPPEHGGAKNIRQILGNLSAAGITCRVLVKLQSGSYHRFAGQHCKDIENRTANDTWIHEGVEYIGVHGDSNELAKKAENEIELFKPDGVLLYDDALDDATNLFRVGADSGRLLYFAQTIHCLPFGPYSMLKNEAVTESIKKARQIFAPSLHVKNYVENELARSVHLYYPNVFGSGPFPLLGSLLNPYITMINPCPWKGSSIFLKLARSRPDLSFAVVPTWGATPSLLEEIHSISNITVLRETEQIDSIFRQTKILIAPSICQEAFGLISPEALLRGIPVIASDIAGLKESTLGAAKLIPVLELPFENPPKGSDHTKFKWDEPNNPIEPWSNALDSILEENNYSQISKWGKEKAEQFVTQLEEQNIVAMIKSALQ